MSGRCTFGFACVVGLTLLAGCSDGGVGNLESIDFRMQRLDGGVSLQSVAGWSASLAGVSATVVDPDAVQSLTVTIDSIQALPVENAAEEDSDAAWVTVNLASAATVDLMELPTEGASPVTVAAGTLEAGDYANVRLFISDATIVFKGQIDVGVGSSFEGGVEYDVNIPSSAQTGIKTDASFSASADVDVDLLFDTEASFLSVTATGNGQVIMAPVIRARSS